MIYFIIYEDEKKFQKNYITNIENLMKSKKEKYHILTYNKYTKELNQRINTSHSKKIYLLDVHVPIKSGLEVAKEIRSSGDWTSPIIIITSQDDIIKKGLKIKLLILSLISKKENIDEKLTSDLKTAIHIHSHHKTFNFTYNNEFFRIPYEDILYFEKDLNNNYTSIITKDNTYKIKKSITKIESDLEERPEFFKTHQSCIVNLKNIVHVNFTTNTIYFKTKTIDLLSRNKKKELKEILEQEINQDIF